MRGMRINKYLLLLYTIEAVLCKIMSTIGRVYARKVVSGIKFEIRSSST